MGSPSKSLLLRCAFLIILTGFFIAQWVPFAPLLMLISCVVLVWGWGFSRQAFGFLFLFVTSLNYASWNNLDTSDALKKFNQQTVKIQGVVVSFPDERMQSNRNYVKVTKIIAPEYKLIKSSKVLLVSQDLLRYGTEVQITGKLTKPRNFQDFDYQKYLHRFGVSYIIRSPVQIQTLSRKGGNPILRTAEKIRNTLENNLEENLSSPHSTIAMGILLGVKKELPPPVKQDFQDSGLMHILVVSGFNISVIMIVCNFWFRRLGPRINLFCSILVVGFFVLMTGAEAPVVRAAIMGSLVGLAVSNGNFSESKNVLLLSAVLMGAINPSIIQADLGFFFSFAATAGIIFLVPRLTPYFQWMPNRLEFRNVFLVTLSSQIAVFPIQTYFFGVFPTGGLLANQFTEPVIPLAMLFSSIVAILGFLPNIILKIISIPAWICLELLLFVASLFSNFPTISVPEGVSIILGGALLGAFVWWNVFQERALRQIDAESSSE